MTKYTKKILIVGSQSEDIELLRNITRAKGLETIEDLSGENCIRYTIGYEPVLVIMFSSFSYYT